MTPQKQDRVTETAAKKNPQPWTWDPECTLSERPQNKPEGKQAVGQTQSGPEALVNVVGLLGDSVFWGTQGVLLQSDPPPASSTGMNCIVRPLGRLKLPNSSFFPICSHGNPLTSHLIWNSQCQGYSCSINRTGKTIVTRRKMLPERDISSPWISLCFFF